MSVPPQVTDGSRVVAVANPFHNGDVLWQIPAARALARQHDAKVDFWVSEWARNCADLLLAQSFCRRVIVDEEFTVALGREFWMGNAEGAYHGYLRTCQFGFRPGEPRVPIPDYYCGLVALPPQPMALDLPPCPEGYCPAGDFVCLAAKGPHHFSTPTLRDFVWRCPRPVVEVGPAGQAVATDLGALDRCSDGFVRMAQVIARCKWFVGTLSAPLVAAAAFPCLKVVAHDGVQWDLSRAVHDDRHRYVNALAGDAGPILEALG